MIPDISRNWQQASSGELTTHLVWWPFAAGGLGLQTSTDVPLTLHVHDYPSQDVLELRDDEGRVHRMQSRSKKWRR